ncbi:MAG: 3 4-dihydroxy 2-butanone 4-phosphate synthase / GTP cyclohydrolase II [Halothiobacillaceae bacterium]|nr:MAG: 3 4-dihydroxy 2-butanone 4-phosphate synthase / GTP cyclohydrolase II [Halothiobacillaceae bacterium]
MKLNTVEEIIGDIAQGKMVIIMDDEDRENEGDLVMAASWVRPEDINFMARYGRGLVCLTLTQERCQQLRLPLMVSDTHDKHQTSFTVSIEAAAGVTTGISAADRARTVRAAVARDASPSDLVQPGHIFPIMAQLGGVLTRAGHTEAGCDLARLAGQEPAAVIVEILNDDGSMARRPDLERFAQEHSLKIGTVADLIRYRMAREKTITHASECNLTTEWGSFRLIAYEESHRNVVHLALVMGEIKGDEATLVRVHMHDTLGDIEGFAPLAAGWPLRQALQRVAANGSGVVVILRPAPEAKEILHRIKDQALKAQGVVPSKLPQSSDLRTYGIGAQILADLGVRQMRVIGTPKRLSALWGFGLEVVEYIPCE